MTIIQSIKENGIKNPDRIAFSTKDKDYSYRNLLDAMHQIASQMQAQKTNDRPVFVFGKNDFLSLAAMLAASLVGKAYIPVDAHTPLERTQMILTAAKPSLAVITSEDIAEEFTALFNTVPHLSFVKYDELPMFNPSDLDDRQAVSGSDINYLIYTSGTTGVPKGVAVSHDNLLTFTNWMNHDFVQVENNHTLCQPVFSFDLSIFSLYPSLVAGGTLVSMSRDETLNFKLLFERLNSSEINTWISTPSFVDICLLDPSFTSERHPDIKQFIFCGEELTKKTAKKLLDKFPESVIWNTYGPTEATGAITVIRVTSELLEAYTRVPIGFAKPGIKLKIQDPETHKFLDKNELGEVILVGDSVALGYYENPKKTEEAFFVVDGVPAYRTGDAGFIDDKGILNYQGRIDFQVKFNGYRIELQDIEANLLGLAKIKKAIVLADVDDSYKVRGLVAVLVADKDLPEREFTKYIKSELSKTVMEYMIPTKFVYFEDFPLNQNEKVDRKLIQQQVLGGKK